MVMNSSRAVLSLGTWIGTTQRLSRFLSAAGFVADSFASVFPRFFGDGFCCALQVVFYAETDGPHEAREFTGHRRHHFAHGHPSLRQRPVAAVKPLLRSPRRVGDRS